jgi:hypothetical protein
MKTLIARSVVFAALMLLLGGCATYSWVKPNTTAELTAQDEQSCRAQAHDLSMEYALTSYGVALGAEPWRRPWMGPYGDPSMRAAAEQRVYERCMRDRGYDLVRTDTAK